ncbi:hypothetical protein J5N97_008133 [Dioscorea zingiberensis]|uniref:Uncharacterized protein n=1 Tax=Dioscorea zingiberensis TaxID=325984 RepID=A0A9D5HWL8_9LILI|nr:hypothetical protein J5N97_008133 [Dioscorea zingiberensis]
MSKLEVLDFMAHQQHHPQTLHSFYDIALKPPCPSSSSLKIKTIVQAYILRHVSHVVRALSNAKSMVMELLKRKSTTTITNYSIKLRKKKNKKQQHQQQLFSSFRMHYNWCSSYVTPMPEPPLSFEGFDMSHAAYYDSTWNSVISTDQDGNEDMDQQQQQLSGYLSWLEEESSEALPTNDDAGEIDRLAEKFIARCHEKFRLEKQESYRRYQEMLARKSLKGAYTMQM